MVEPWLIGANKPSTEQRVQLEKANMGEITEVSQGKNFRNDREQNNLMGFIKALHSGKVGNTDLSVFLDIVASALIILTTTGIILSIKRLKANL